MDYFPQAMERVFRAEGGYGCPDQPTNWGITQRTLEALGMAHTLEDVKALTRAQAADIYRKQYWNATHLNTLSSMRVAVALFDQLVNRGPVPAIEDAQRALVALGYRVRVDGVLGSETRAALDAVDETKFVLRFVALAQNNYVRLAQLHPSNVRFLSGWLHRTQSLLFDLI